MASSADDHDMFLEVGQTYRMQMMTGDIIEALITDTHGVYNTFHCKVGRASKQYYYWDVDGAEKL